MISLNLKIIMITTDTNCTIIGADSDDNTIIVKLDFGQKIKGIVLGQRAKIHFDKKPENEATENNQKSLLFS